MADEPKSNPDQPPSQEGQEERTSAAASSEPGGGEKQIGEPKSPPADAQPKSDVVYCVRCGAVMARGDLFCHACGWDSRLAPPPPARADPNPSDRNRLAALLLCILLGWAGLHRFYVGKVGTGLIWLFTLGFLGIGVVYDLVLIGTGEFRDEQGRRLVRWE